MWKDFFYFSKSERRAILFLLTLLFIFMCIWVLFPVKEESLEPVSYTHLRAHET